MRPLSEELAEKATHSLLGEHVVVTLYDYEVSRGYRTKMVTPHRAIIKVPRERNPRKATPLGGNRLLEAGQRARQPPRISPLPHPLPPPPPAAPPPEAGRRPLVGDVPTPAWSNALPFLYHLSALYLASYLERSSPRGRWTAIKLGFYMECFQTSGTYSDRLFKVQSFSLINKSKF